MTDIENKILELDLSGFDPYKMSVIGTKHVLITEVPGSNCEADLAMCAHYAVPIIEKMIRICRTVKDIKESLNANNTTTTTNDSTNPGATGNNYF